MQHTCLKHSSPSSPVQATAAQSCHLSTPLLPCSSTEWPWLPHGTPRPLGEDFLSTTHALLMDEEPDLRSVPATPPGMCLSAVLHQYQAAVFAGGGLRLPSSFLHTPALSSSSSPRARRKAAMPVESPQYRLDTCFRSASCPMSKAQDRGLELRCTGADMAVSHKHMHILYDHILYERGHAV